MKFAYLLFGIGIAFTILAFGVPSFSPEKVNLVSVAFLFVAVAFIVASFAVGGMCWAMGVERQEKEADKLTRWVKKDAMKIAQDGRGPRIAVMQKGASL